MQWLTLYQNTTNDTEMLKDLMRKTLIMKQTVKLQRNHDAKANNNTNVLINTEVFSLISSIFSIIFLGITQPTSYCNKIRHGNRFLS